LHFFFSELFAFIFWLKNWVLSLFLLICSSSLYIVRIGSLPVMSGKYFFYVIWLLKLFKSFLSFFSRFKHVFLKIHLFICAYIVWAISPPCPSPLPLHTSHFQAESALPFLQFCWREVISNNKNTLALLPCTSVLQP
jgi:hypothetical protein